eukprot:1158115-Pelagomonas_calceolata.AAC.3
MLYAPACRSRTTDQVTAHQSSHTRAHIHTHTYMHTGYFKGGNAQLAITPASSAQGAFGEASRSGHDSNRHAVSAPEWQGGLPMHHLSHFRPDEGPLELKPQHGLVTIGSGPWVVNYNVPVMLQIAKGSGIPGGAETAGPRQQDEGDSGDNKTGPGNKDTTSELLQLAKVLARGVSERGGGLKLVESMALAHEDGVVEVACNLLGGGEGAAPSDVQVLNAHARHVTGRSRCMLQWGPVPPYQSHCSAPAVPLQAYIEELAKKLNEGAVKLIVGQGYQTGKAPQELVQLTMHALASG